MAARVPTIYNPDNQTLGPLAAGDTLSLTPAQATALATAIGFTGHQHAIADVTGLQTALDAKLPTATFTGHQHAIADVTGLQTALNAKLNLTGGSLTGTLFGTIGSFSGLLYSAGLAAVGTVQTSVVDNGNAFQVNNSLAAAVAALCPINRGGGNYSFGIYGYGGAIGNGWRAVFEHDGLIKLGKTNINPDNSNLEVGVNGTGDRFSYIDFHAHGTPGANDFSARTIRGPGVNGELGLINSGTGRTYLGVDSTRIAYLDTTLPVGNSALIHNNNLHAWVASGDTQELGKFVFAADITGARNAGDAQSGVNLRFSSANNTLSGSALVAGTWRCHGQTGAAGEGTVWQRIA